MGCFGSDAPDAPQPDPHMQAFIDVLSGITKDQYDFATANYKPLELKAIADAEKFRSPEYASRQAATAEADVTKQYENARQQLDVDPLTNNPQYASTRRVMGIAQAGQTAAAGTTARTNAELTGFNVTAGLAGRGDAKVNQAIGAAGTGGQLLNQQFQTQSGNWQFGQNQNAQGMAGLGSLLGTVGMGAIMASSKKVKHSVKEFKHGLDAVEAMPVKKWRYKEGVADGGEHEHIGPMAEDFHSATGVGTDQAIHIGDAVGTTMQAVRELHDRVKTLEKTQAKAAVAKNVAD